MLCEIKGKKAVEAMLEKYRQAGFVVTKKMEWITDEEERKRDRRNYAPVWRVTSRPNGRHRRGEDIIALAYEENAFVYRTE